MKNNIKFKGIKFLSIVAITYIILFILDFDNIIIAFAHFKDIIIMLIPIFVFIILLTAVINYFLQPKKMMKHFGKDSKKRSILYVLIAGILSHGPMYAWYGILEDMRKHGMKDGFIALFLYSRAVKLPLLPFMIELFGITFTIVINIYIIVFAIIQSIIINKLITNKEIK